LDRMSAVSVLLTDSAILIRKFTLLIGSNSEVDKV